MDIFAILNGSIYFVMAILVWKHVFSNWYNEKVKPYRYSEAIYGVLYIMVGIFFIIYLDVADISKEVAFSVNLIVFTIQLSIIIWIYYINIYRQYMRVKDDPEKLKELDYERYIANLIKIYNEENANNSNSKDIMKDLSRKALHLVVLALAFLIPMIAESEYMQPYLENWALTTVAFRNTMYLVAAGFFLIMFTTADYFRFTNFPALPGWAHKWYFKSVDLKTETHTFISSIPFLLGLMACLFHPEMVVIYGAAIISCVSDSVASVIGKSFGEHKMEKIGLFPNKSFEGLLAGAFSAYIGVFLVFYNFHPASDTLWNNIFAITGAIIFVLVDLYGKKVADNILNTVIPAGVFSLLLLAI